MASQPTAIPSAVGAAITPMLLSWNEEANLARSLDRLFWASRVLLVDSGSTDATLAIAARYPQVEVVERPFDSFAAQCNFGLERIQTPWVLSLDADYLLSEAFLRALCRFDPSAEVAGYRVPLSYCIGGEPLRGSLLPPRISLYRRQFATYHNDGHAHRVQIAGPVAPWPAPILHDDRKPLSRWLASQERYLKLEADKLRAAPRSQLSRIDRLRRRTWIVPLLVLPYCLVLQQGLLDSWRGWFYAFQRLYAEVLLSLLLLEADHPP